MKKKKFILVSVLILLIYINTSISIVFGKSIELPEGESAFLIENNSQDTILNQGGEEKINPAEMNQLMTVLVSLDVIGTQLSGKVTVGSEVNDLSNDINITGFEEGQEVTYQDLLYSILLNGSYDGATVLANNIGLKLLNETKGDGIKGTETFVKKMNEKAKEIGLINTNFTNPVGYDEENNYSTIQDLAILTQNLFNNETVKRILSSTDYTIKLSNVKVQEPEESETDITTQEQESSKNNQITESASTNIKIETPTIPIKNQFLPLLTAKTDTQNKTEEDSNTQDEEILQDKNSKEEITDSGIIDNETDQQESLIQQDTENTEKESSEQNLEKNITLNNSSANKIAYIANLDNDYSIIAFESDVNDAKIIGCLTGNSSNNLANEINSISNDLKQNYVFKTLADESGNFGTFSLDNTSLFSKKNLDITANSPVKVYVPKDEQENIKTNIIWNKDIANQNNDNLTLVQSVEPGTQVGQLEISKGELKRLIPLYSSTKAKVKTWIDSVLTFLIWFVLITIILLIVWRLIYVRNRRRVLQRQRARKRKKRQALAQKRKSQVQYRSVL